MDLYAGMLSFGRLTFVRQFDVSLCGTQGMEVLPYLPTLCLRCCFFVHRFVFLLMSTLVILIPVERISELISIYRLVHEVRSKNKCAGFT